MSNALPKTQADLIQLFEPVRADLEAVEREYERQVQSQVHVIPEIGAYIQTSGGKRVRPAVLLMAARLCGYTGPHAVLNAAVVEFIHTATLVHDDIIDEADVRRGRTSINYRWGNDLTVLVGDYLYAHSMAMALAEGNLDILRLLSDATIKMIEGEILGTEQNGRADLSVEDYFEIVRRKTAALFGATCRIPGFFVDLPESSIAALHTYGYNLGICFQLIDDLLDFTSSTEVLGKPALSDLKEGKVTLPLILAMPRATDRERDLIAAVAHTKSFNGTDPSEVLAIVNRYDTLEQTREIASDYANRARKALESFPASPAKEALEVALDFVLERDR